MEAPKIRLLVVDDYPPWWGFIRAMLQTRPEIQIVCEVSDGLGAVQKAQELQPDLIFLDIGLPGLSGIEAARQIRSRSPKSKILFLSQESSPEVVQGALNAGAEGYVVKSHAARELLPAVDAVLQSRQFVGASLTRDDLSNLRDEHAADHLRVGKFNASLQLQDLEVRRHHQVELYPDDVAFVDGFAHFIETALKTGDAVVVITTESHRTNIIQRLGTDGVDPALNREQIIFLDVADSLSAFTVDASGDTIQFAKAGRYPFVEAVNAAREKHLHLAVGWECPITLWAQGKADAAIQQEHLFDELAQKQDVDVQCGCVVGRHDSEPGTNIIKRICAQHSAVYSHWSCMAAFSAPASSRRRNSVSSIWNSEKPQSKQIAISGNAQTDGLVRLFGPGKWMLISQGNVLWFFDWQQAQDICPPSPAKGYLRGWNFELQLPEGDLTLSPDTLSIQTGEIAKIQSDCSGGLLFLQSR